jgi:hypothetical protein
VTTNLVYVMSSLLYSLVNLRTVGTQLLCSDNSFEHTHVCSLVDEGNMQQWRCSRIDFSIFPIKLDQRCFHSGYSTSVSWHPSVSFGMFTFIWMLKNLFELSFFCPAGHEQKVAYHQQC